MLRVAALYDIHGNLPALDAVLGDVRRTGVDRVVVGGDVIPGPMPRETLTRLFDLGIPVDFIYGNGELAVLAHAAAGDSSDVTYWGTASGAPPPKPVLDAIRWNAQQLRLGEIEAVGSWPGSIEIVHPELGHILFCHGTPWSETDTFTRLTPDESLLPLFQHLRNPLVICGHTHMQCDRCVGSTRVVNAGSVGMPFGPPGAYWLLLDEDVHLQHTTYDLTAAADRVRATEYPQAQEFAARSILGPPPEEEMARALASLSFGQDGLPLRQQKSLPPTAASAIAPTP